MKLKLRLTSAVLAVATLVLIAQPARASLTYVTGDLFLGFHATGGTGATTDYLVNIGASSQFTTSTPTFTLSGLGNIGADLVATYGANWNTRSDLTWSISGTTYDGTNAAILYASRPEATVGVSSTPWLGKSPSTQVVTAGLFQQLSGEYATNGTATGNSTKATFQIAGSTSSYSTFIKPTLLNDFNAWSTIQGTFNGGTAANALDLFKINNVFNQASVRQGYFTLDNSGVLSFNSVAVPEPSTYALLGLGMAALLILRRRQHRSVQS